METKHLSQRRPDSPSELYLKRINNQPSQESPNSSLFGGTANIQPRQESPNSSLFGSTANNQPRQEASNPSLFGTNNSMNDGIRAIFNSIYKSNQSRFVITIEQVEWVVVQLSNCVKSPYKLSLVDLLPSDNKNLISINLSNLANCFSDPEQIFPGVAKKIINLVNLQNSDSGVNTTELTSIKLIIRDLAAFKREYIQNKILEIKELQSKESKTMAEQKQIFDLYDYLFKLDPSNQSINNTLYELYTAGAGVGKNIEKANFHAGLAALHGMNHSVYFAPPAPPSPPANQTIKVPLSNFPPLPAAPRSSDSDLSQAPVDSTMMSPNQQYPDLIPLDLGINVGVPSAPPAEKEHDILDVATLSDAPPQQQLYPSLSQFQVPLTTMATAVQRDVAYLNSHQAQVPFTTMATVPEQVPSMVPIAPKTTVSIESHSIIKSFDHLRVIDYPGSTKNSSKDNTDIWDDPASSLNLNNPSQLQQDLKSLSLKYESHMDAASKSPDSNIQFKMKAPELYLLGFLQECEFGEHKPDPVASAKSYQAAIDEDPKCYAAKYRLAELIKDGRGVEQNIEKAITMLRECYEAKYVPGAIAYAYLLKRNNLYNLQKSKWFSTPVEDTILKSIEKNYNLQDLVNLYQKELDLRKLLQEKEAIIKQGAQSPGYKQKLDAKNNSIFKLAKELHQQNSIYGTYILGECRINGWSCEKDVSAVKKYTLTAALHGLPWAVVRVKEASYVKIVGPFAAPTLDLIDKRLNDMKEYARKDDKLMAEILRVSQPSSYHKFGTSD